MHELALLTEVVGAVALACASAENPTVHVVALRNDVIERYPQAARQFLAQIIADAAPVGTHLAH